jgi:hypothetical protein
MSSSNLMRWGGLAALVGGALLVVVNILESLFFGSQLDIAAVTSSTWIILEVAFLVAEILIILGLVVLYARQSEQVGTLGLIAFLVALTGTVLVAGIDWSAAFFAPWLAGIAPPGLLDAEPTGTFVAGIFLSLVLTALGWLLFGVASLQAGVLPRGAAVLLMVGAVLMLVMSILEIPFDVVVFGVALSWMGYALWSASDTP